MENKETTSWFHHGFDFYLCWGNKKVNFALRLVHDKANIDI